MNTCFFPHRVAYRRGIVAVFASVLLVTTLYATESTQFPDGFRRWVHVGTGVIMPGTSPQLESEAGMHHIFANTTAVAGYASGRFADGSILVYELRDINQRNGVGVEGDRKRVDVMIKDSRHYGETGGWRFERFWTNDQSQNAVRDSGTECFQCHSNARQQGFVFSHFQ